MPVKKKIMKAMKKEYGKKKGEQVYFAMENKMGIPFKKKAKGKK